MPIASGYHMYPCGDHALTIEWGNAIDVTVNKTVMALFALLKDANIIGIKDIIPAYNTVTVVYDMPFLKKQTNTTTVYEWMSSQVGKCIDDSVIDIEKAVRLVRIPVCYDLSLAPDLSFLASEHSINTDEVIKLHTGKNYRVFMIGFMPGFAYMGSVDQKIITARRSNPRTLVPAGSVGIAGEQTGIYPFDSPGGWQLIGQTPIKMFDAQNEQPCYLQPGDEVQFYSITTEEFQNIRSNGHPHS